MSSRKSTTATAPKAKANAEAAGKDQQDRVTLVGRLCADPALRHTKSGKAVSTIRIAVNAPDAEPTFHSVVVWGRTAEVVCQFLKKGRPVEVAGRSQERSYEVDGAQRTVTEVIAQNVKFLSRQASSPSTAQELS
jgi:single-strand DNA-binding protein